MLVNEQSSVGMVPVIEFSQRPRYDNDGNIPISDGIVPVIELLSMENKVNDNNIPISDGNVPRRPFLVKSIRVIWSKLSHVTP